MGILFLLYVITLYAVDSLPSILFIQVWFRTFPKYYDMCLLGILHNPTIDLLLITDRDPDIPFRPPNMKIIKMNQSDLCRHTQNLLNVTLCEKDTFSHVNALRPTYGYIFPHFIRGYDWWGHLDLDVLLGDVRHFLKPDILNASDTLTADTTRMAGPFSIFKNTPRVNMVFQHIKPTYKLMVPQKMRKIYGLPMFPRTFQMDEGPITKAIRANNLVLATFEGFAPREEYTIWFEGQLYGYRDGVLKTYIVQHNSPKISPTWKITNSTKFIIINWRKKAFEQCFDCFKHKTGIKNVGNKLFH
eukprot:NODE_5190_length_1052_cov_49.321851_g4631_i0.p1 GENE.NODE_5190_length_1052_cov_49.321851_g4631_i0~~NODE_5190_length_1052_cov_49.321851_g4631_i0.p1  ORF type:complete len:301 (-),score=22.94 NODE_5190_length_1052_cov_49.321851_g4631_i0:64-966(-)